MTTRNKKILSAMLVGALLLTAAGPAGAAQRHLRDNHTADEMFFDAVFLRPFGLLASCVGAGIFLVTLPFSAPGGNAGEAAEKLVGDPLRYTFDRPLGEVGTSKRH